MVTTTDPLNFILESIRTQLNSTLTDPKGDDRDAGTPFITIGPALQNPQYPFIHIGLSNVVTQDSGLGGALSSSESGKNITGEVLIRIFTDEETIARNQADDGDMSNDRLLRNIGSGILVSLTQLTGKQTLDGSYDIKNVEQGDLDDVISPNDDGELMLATIYDIDFNWRY